MEIIAIAFERGLKYRNRIENKGIIRFGEAQVMSSGIGIQYSVNECKSNKLSENIAVIGIS